MKLKVLVDNNTFIDEYYLGEPAVSYYIEDEDTKILFDTGYSEAFIKNAKNMKIDLRKIDKNFIDTFRQKKKCNDFYFPTLIYW